MILKKAIYLAFFVGIILTINLVIIANSEVFEVGGSINQTIFINITYPLNTSYDANVIFLNYTVTHYNNIHTCWYSLDNAITNTTTICDGNISVSSGEGVFNWTVYANNSFGNLTTSKVNFSVAFQAPITVLDHPLNETMHGNGTDLQINWTTTDPNGIDTCQVWHNDTGTFRNEKNRTDIISTVQATQKFNFSDGNITYNVWCNDTTGRGNWSTLGNFTFTVDTTDPVINTVDITTTAGSQTVPFDVTSYTETYCNETFYSVFNSTGGIELALENVSTSCDTFSDTFVVSAFATYNLTVYMRDKAGNLGLKDQQFTTSQIVPPSDEGTGGTRGGDDDIVRTEALNFTIQTITSGEVMDFVLTLGSVKDRQKEFLIINQDIEPIEITLTCDTTSLNETTEEGQLIDICEFVKFEKETLLVSPNEQDPTRGKIFITTPLNSTFGDKYNFNIIATRARSETVREFAKLSVGSRVPLWAIMFKWSYLPFQGEELPEEKSNYPILPLALLVALLVFTTIYLTLRKNMPVTVLILSSSLMILTFGTLLFLL